MNPHDDASYYEQAASEIANGKPDRGLFAKAFSAALGNEEKTRAIYIRYRVEQLQADIASKLEEERRRVEDQVSRSGMKRKEYLVRLRQEFGFLKTVRIPESDLPSAAFTGNCQQLRAPALLSDVADALEILEFKLIDAVKAGLVEGVIDSDDQWWLSTKNRS